MDFQHPPSKSPISFLQSFNQMSDNFQASLLSSPLPPPSHTKISKSKLTLFKKFPLHNYYNEIESYDGWKDIKDVEVVRVSKFDKKDEKFKKRHDNQMKRFLNGMIENNIRHIKALEKNREYYRKQSEWKVVELNNTGKDGDQINSKAMKEKQKYEVSPTNKSSLFPRIDPKAIVPKNRSKSSFMISFNPPPQTSTIQTNSLPKQRSISSMKIRSPHQISKLLSTKRTYSIVNISSFNDHSTSLNYKQINPRKQSVVTVNTQRTVKSLKSLKTNRTQKSRKVLQIEERPKEGGEKKKEKKSLSEEERIQMEVDVLLNPEEYIKKRFKTPVKGGKIDFDMRWKKVVDEFSSDIDRCYAETIGVKQKKYLGMKEELQEQQQ